MMEKIPVIIDTDPGSNGVGQDVFFRYRVIPVLILFPWTDQDPCHVLLYIRMREHQAPQCGHLAQTDIIHLLTSRFYLIIQQVQYIPAFFFRKPPPLHKGFPWPHENGILLPVICCLYMGRRKVRADLVPIIHHNKHSIYPFCYFASFLSRLVLFAFTE